MNSTKSKILALFLKHENQYLSGEKIANELGISRTAVWKNIQSLKNAGHHFQSITNKGYLYIPSDVLSAEVIQQLLPDPLSSLNIEVASSTESTNKDLKVQAINGGKANTIKIVNQQTQTVGRFGRHYFAEQGKGIYFSILLTPDQALDEVALYTVIAAVAVRRAIQIQTKQEMEIKWVNDLYLNGKKVCGILSEALTNMETQTISHIIVGIGLNFSIPQKDFPEELQTKATSLYADGQPDISRNQLIAEILIQFYQLLSELPEKKFMEEYRNHSFVLGKTVSFTYQQKKLVGTAVDIDSFGQLIVQLSDGEQLTLASGEISLTQIQ